jgi:hypothetical protein
MSAEPGASAEAPTCMNSEPETKKLLELIDQMLVAKPFVPFRVRLCGTLLFEIRQPHQGRFNRFGGFEFRQEAVKVTICNNDHITEVKPL